MEWLTAEERVLLAEVLKRRLGARGDGPALATAYLRASQRSAFDRTVANAPVPTSLTAERSALLIEVSRELGRLIEDFEVQAILRVTPSAARSIRRNLVATYADDASDIAIRWALRGAVRGDRIKYLGNIGTEVQLDSRERRDEFVVHAPRLAAGVVVLAGLSSAPWRVWVPDAFAQDLLPPKK